VPPRLRAVDSNVQRLFCALMQVSAPLTCLVFVARLRCVHIAISRRHSCDLSHFADARIHPTHPRTHSAQRLEDAAARASAAREERASSGREEFEKVMSRLAERLRVLDEGVAVARRELDTELAEAHARRARAEVANSLQQGCGQANRTSQDEKEHRWMAEGRGREGRRKLE